MNAQASAAPIPNAVRPSASFTAPLMNGPLPVKWREPPPKATHDAIDASSATMPRPSRYWTRRSEEHTSELQSHSDLVCRLLLEKKKKNTNHTHRQVKG